MASVQDRLKLKRESCDTWSTREQLCLASSVLKSGDQNWISVSRSLRPFAEKEALRPPDWFSQKSCAIQYAILLENADTPKRKKRESGETTSESIVRRLTQERVTELGQILAFQRDEYQQLKTEVNLLKSGNVSDDRLQKMWQAIEQEEREAEQKARAHSVWLAKRQQKSEPARDSPRKSLEAPSDHPELQEFQPETDEDRKSRGGRSPLLTSLLKSPSPTTQMQNPSTAQATSPTIASLLGATTNQPKPTTPQIPRGVDTPAPQLHFLQSNLGSSVQTVPERPSAGAPTLSMLLELPSNLNRGNISALQTQSSLNEPPRPPQQSQQPQNIAQIPVQPTPVAETVENLIEQIDDVIGKDNHEPIDKDEINEIIGDIEELIKEEITKSPKTESTGVLEISSNLESKSMELNETNKHTKATTESENSEIIGEIDQSSSSIAEIIGAAIESETKKSESIDDKIEEKSLPMDIDEVKEKQEELTEKEEKIQDKIEPPEEKHEGVDETPVSDVTSGDLVPEKSDSGDLEDNEEGKIDENGEKEDIATEDEGKDEEDNNEKQDKPQDDEKSPVQEKTPDAMDDAENDDPEEPPCGPEEPKEDESDEPRETEDKPDDAEEDKKSASDTPEDSKNSKESDADVKSPEEPQKESDESQESQEPVGDDTKEPEECAKSPDSADKKTEDKPNSNEKSDAAEEPSPKTDLDEELEPPVLPNEIDDLPLNKREILLNEIRAETKSEGKESDEEKEEIVPIKDESMESEEKTEQVKVEENETKLEKTEKTDKIEKLGKSEKNDKAEKLEKLEKVEKVEKVEKAEKAEKVDKLEKEEVKKEDGVKKEELVSAADDTDVDEEESSLSKSPAGRAMKTYSKKQNAVVDSEPETETSDTAEYKIWKKSILLHYSRLATHKYASLFLRPITEDQAPGYHSVVFRPMDLSAIKKNIDNGTIRTNMQFQRDVMLMFQNAIMYNKSDSFVYKMALSMQEECLQSMQILVEATGEGAFRRETRTAASSSCESSENILKRKRSLVTPSPLDTDSPRMKKRRKSEND